MLLAAVDNGDGQESIDNESSWADRTDIEGSVLDEVNRSHLKTETWRQKRSCLPRRPSSCRKVSISRVSVRKRSVSCATKTSGAVEGALLLQFIGRWAVDHGSVNLQLLYSKVTSN